MIADGNWHPTRWYRAIDEDGNLWCESSDLKEVKRLARPTDRIERLYARTDQEWRVESK